MATWWQQNQGVFGLVESSRLCPWHRDRARRTPCVSRPRLHGSHRDSGPRIGLKMVGLYVALCNAWQVYSGKKSACQALVRGMIVGA